LWQVQIPVYLTTSHLVRLLLRPGAIARDLDLSVCRTQVCLEFASLGDLQAKQHMGIPADDSVISCTSIGILAHLRIPARTSVYILAITHPYFLWGQEIQFG